MLVYRGTFNWFEYAVNEAITFVFPTDLSLGEPVSACWQWTQDKHGTEKVDMAYNGVIDCISLPEKRIGCFYNQWYKFDGIVEPNFKSLTVRMRDPSSNTQSNPFTLELSYSEPPFTPRCLIYTGKLNFLDYAQNETLTVVVPSPAFNEGDTVCVYWEWTGLIGGEKKGHQDFVGPMQIGETKLRGAKQLSIPGVALDWFRFDGEVNGNRDVMTLTMTHAQGQKSEVITLRLANDLMFRKKALLVRYGVNIDGSITAVRDMLINALGFRPGNVEMLYYDVEPSKGPCQMVGRYGAPTAARFCERLVALLRDANPGDVRFVYLDAPGMPLHGSDPHERGKDKAWKLAKGDDGVETEPVLDDSIAHALKEHLNPGVNLTILATSCLSGALLDPHRNPPGVLLASCHDTQINVKALKTGEVKEPWTHAILQEIEMTKKGKKRMPSYSLLFNRARLNICAMHDSGALGHSYKGPSPDPSRPIAPREQTSANQDPQLVFNRCYIDADNARFLEPLPVSLGQNIS